MTQIIDEHDNLIDLATGEQIMNPNGVQDLVTSEAPPRFVSEVAVLKPASILTGYKSMPLYLQKLANIEGMDAAKKASMLASYIASQSSPITDYLGQEIGICGAILYESGQYQSQVTKSLADGYATILLKTNMKKEVPLVGSTKRLKKTVVLACSGKYLAQWALPAMEAMGWFDWPTTLQVVFLQGSDKRISVELIEE